MRRFEEKLAKIKLFEEKNGKWGELRSFEEAWEPFGRNVFSMWHRTLINQKWKTCTLEHYLCLLSFWHECWLRVALVLSLHSNDCIDMPQTGVCLPHLMEGQYQPCCWGVPVPHLDDHLVLRRTALSYLSAKCNTK